MSNPLVENLKGNKGYQDMDDVAGKPASVPEDQAATTDEGEQPAETPAEQPASPTIDDIFNEVENAPKGKKKVQLTVYIDEDVAKAFSKYAKPIGKGAKSETINKFLKAKFKI